MTTENSATYGPSSKMIRYVLKWVWRLPAYPSAKEVIALLHCAAGDVESCLSLIRMDRDSIGVSPYVLHGPLGPDHPYIPRYHSSAMRVVSRRSERYCRVFQRPSPLGFLAWYSVSWALSERLVACYIVTRQHQRNSQSESDGCCCVVASSAILNGAGP